MDFGGTMENIKEIYEMTFTGDGHLTIETDTDQLVRWAVASLFPNERFELQMTFSQNGQHKIELFKTKEDYLRVRKDFHSRIDSEDNPT